MSHFTVFVKAENEQDLLEQMLPFYEYGCGSYDDHPIVKRQLVWENTEPEYRQQWENDSQEFVVDNRDVYPRLLLPFDKSFENKETWKTEPPKDARRVAIPYKTLFPTFESYMKEWCEDEYHPEHGYGYWHNPGKTWDWYIIGGRWSGSLLLKNGERVDTAIKSDVDFEKIRQERKEHASGAWKKTEAILRQVNITMDEHLRKANGDDARQYWQDLRLILKDGYMHVCFEFEPYDADYESHCEAAYNNAITYALLDNKGWLARGEMGWFGIDSNRRDDYPIKFWERVGEWSDEARVYVVDCHI